MITVLSKIFFIHDNWASDCCLYADGVKGSCLERFLGFCMIVKNCKMASAYHGHIGSYCIPLQTMVMIVIMANIKKMLRTMISVMIMRKKIMITIILLFVDLWFKRTLLLLFRTGSYSAYLRTLLGHASWASCTWILIQWTWSHFALV